MLSESVSLYLMKFLKYKAKQEGELMFPFYDNDYFAHILYQSLEKRKLDGRSHGSLQLPHEGRHKGRH